MPTVASKNALITLMSSPNHIYEGWHVLPGGGKGEFISQWADVADLIFINCLPRDGGTPSDARQAFIDAMGHAVSNEGLKATLENAFLAYIQLLEVGLDASTFLPPVRPILSDLSQNIATLGSLESNQWAIETISGALASWGLKYTASITGPITGLLPLYKGTVAGIISLGNSASGGVWSSGTPGTATIGSSTGAVTAVAAGTTLISYAVTNEFGTSTSVVTLLVTVTTLPDITGTLSVAAGANTTLANTITGGTWTSATPAKATVNASTGVVHGVASGTSIITYTMADGSSVSATVTVS